MTVGAEHVTKAFGDKLVLQDFSVELPSAGTIALMGPSGCGKTTLLRLLAGLEQPDAGQITLPERRRLAVVFQEDRLLQVLSARGNLMAVLEKGQEAEADVWLERMGLLEDANMFPAQMSGGMRRRLAIARAMAYNGDLLLLDEPFLGLDLVTKDLVMQHMLAARRLTDLTVMVTHDRNEAERFCDRLMIMDGPPLRVVQGFH